MDTFDEYTRRGAGFGSLAPPPVPAPAPGGARSLLNTGVIRGQGATPPVLPPPTLLPDNQLGGSQGATGSLGPILSMLFGGGKK